MKKMTKRIAGLTLGAALAFTIGAGVYNVYDAYGEQSTVTASAAAAYTIDMADTIEAVNWGLCEDYKEAGLYRFLIDRNSTNSWATEGKCLNENPQSQLLEYIKINGKSIAQHRSEYAALLSRGETSPITWTGMPNNEGRIMQPNIVSDVNNGKAIYAPIFANLCNHGTGYQNAIDIYIPTSFISEVTSIEFSKDFTWSNGTDTWGLRDNVVWTKNSFGGSKQIGEGEEKTVVATEVTGINSAPGADNSYFLSFYLSEHDYSGNTVAANKADLLSINYYDYILIDGEMLGTLLNGSQSEIFYNVWGRNNSFSTRWPNSMNNATAIEGVKEITILKGCQFPAQTAENTVYEVQEDITFTRQENGSFVNLAAMIDAEDVNISMATVTGSAKELYEVTIDSDEWTFNVKNASGRVDFYDLNYYSTDRIAIRQNIYINGKSIYEINTTVDDSAYVYSTEPSKSNDLKQTSPIDSKDYDVFQVPVVVVATEDSLKLQIHKDYVDSLCKTFGDVLEITVKKDISASTKLIGKGLKEDASAVVYGIGYDLALMDGAKELETLSILPGAPLTNLPTPTAEHKTFVAWVDAEGNPAPATMPNENYALYAKWAMVPYELTIVYMDATTKTFTFGIEVDEENGIELSVNDLKAVLQENLPAETEETAYGYVEKVPSVFTARDYTFTVTTVQSVFTITFTDEDGNDIGVAPITFTRHTIDDLVLPAVPEREGYTGAWNKTTDRLKWEDVTLYAVYTEIKEETKLPEAPDSSEDENDETSDTTSDSTTNEAPGGAAGLLAGCSGVVGGVAGGVVALGVAVVAVLKKKED